MSMDEIASYVEVPKLVGIDVVKVTDIWNES